MASRKSSRTSILKTRCDAGPEDLNFDNGDGGGVTRNLTGVINRHRVSFSQTNHVQEFEKSNSSVEGSISETVDFNETICDLNMSIQSEDDNAHGQDKTENGNQTRLVGSDMSISASVYNSTFNETAASCFTEPVASRSFHRKNQSRQSESSNCSPNDTFSKTSDLTKMKHDLNMSISDDEDNGTQDKENRRSDANRTNVGFADMSVYQQDLPNQTMSWVRGGSYGTDTRFEATDMSLCPNPSLAVMSKARRAKFGLMDMDISVYQGHHMDEITGEETSGHDVNKTTFEVADMSVCDQLSNDKLIVERHDDENTGDGKKNRFDVADMSIYQRNPPDEFGEITGVRYTEEKTGGDFNETRFQLANMQIYEDQTTGETAVNDKDREEQNMKIGSVANKAKVDITDNSSSVYHALPANTANTESGMPAKLSGTRLYFSPTNHEQLRDILGQLKTHKRKPDRLPQISYGKFGSAKTPKSSQIQKSIEKKRPVTQVDAQTSHLFQTFPQTVVVDKAILATKSVSEVQVQTSSMIQATPQPVILENSSCPTSVLKVPTRSDVFRNRILPDSTKEILRQTSLQSQVPSETGVSKTKSVVQTSSMTVETTSASQIQTPSKQRKATSHTCPQVTTTPSLPVSQQAQAPSEIAVSTQKSVLHVDPDVTSQTIRVSCVQTPPETAVSRRKPVCNTDLQPRFQTPPAFYVDVETKPKTSETKKKSNVLTESEGIACFSEDSQAHAPSETEAPKTQVLAPSVSSSEASVSKIAPFIITDSPVTAPRASVSVSHLQTEETIMLQKKSVASTETDPVKSPIQITSETEVAKNPVVNASPQLKITAHTSMASLSQIQNPPASVISRSKPIASKDPKQAISQVDTVSEIVVSKKSPVVLTNGQVSAETIPFPQDSTLSPAIATSEKNAAVHTSRKLSIETIPDPQVQPSSTEIAIPRKKPIFSIDLQIPAQTQPPPFCASQDQVSAAVSNKKPDVHMFSQVISQTFPSSPLHTLPDIEVSRTSAFHTDSPFNANCTATESFPDNPMTESPVINEKSVCKFTAKTPPSSASKISFIRIRTPVLNKSILERDAIINNTIVPQTPSMIYSPPKASITSKSFMRAESSERSKVQSFQAQKAPVLSTPSFFKFKLRLNTNVYASLNFSEKWGFLTKMQDELSKLTDQEWQDILRLEKIREFFGEQYINAVNVNRERLNDPSPLYRSAMRRLEQMKQKVSK